MRGRRPGAGAGEDDAAVREFAAQWVDLVQGGDVDRHICLGVEDAPADRFALFVDGGQGPAVEVLGSRSTTKPSRAAHAGTHSKPTAIAREAADVE